jgi:DNA-binding winged helix-turn-helix (wHTH) protein
MRLQFAQCVLDLSAQTLERGQKPVPLEPKMLELLEILIRRRPAVVTFKELDGLLWPKVEGTRPSLARLVSELRTALGDTPRNSRIIRSAHKVGYSFGADLVVLPASGDPEPTAIEVRWKKQSFPLTEGEYVAGRGAECSLVIEGESVSRRHARLRVSNGGALIEDLDSKNGTHVNGARISAPTRLAAGDKFALGREPLQLRWRTVPKSTAEVDPDSEPGEKQQQAQK